LKTFPNLAEEDFGEKVEVPASSNYAKNHIPHRHAKEYGLKEDANQERFNRELHGKFIGSCITISL